MGAETANSDRVFYCPRGEWGLGLFCVALFAALLLLFYHPLLASLSWQARVVLGVAAVTASVLAATTVWILPLGRYLTRSLVILHADGITVGRRRIAWSDIDEVGQDPACIGQLAGRLYFRDALRKFFTWRLAGRWVMVPAYSFVFEAVIPALLKARPDVKMAPGVRAGIKGPERGMRPRFWIALAAASLNVLLCWMALQTKYRTFLTRHVALGSRHS